MEPEDIDGEEHTTVEKVTENETNEFEASVDILPEWMTITGGSAGVERLGVRI